MVLWCCWCLKIIGTGESKESPAISSDMTIPWSVQASVSVGERPFDYE